MNAPNTKPWPQRFVFGYQLARIGFNRGRLASLHAAWLLIRPWWMSKRQREERRCRTITR